MTCLFKFDFNGENATTMLVFLKYFSQICLSFFFNGENATTILLVLQYSSEICLSLILTVKRLLKY